LTIDVYQLLDEIQAIAQTGLHYSDNPFDRERYERLQALAAHEYAELNGLDTEEVRARFAREIGYATARVGADAAVFDQDDQCLLVRRADDDKWGLVAGWVDPNESPAQTAVRELAEEAGITARVDRLVGVFFRSASEGYHPHGAVSVLYLCTRTGGALRPQPHEVTELAFRNIDDVSRDEWHHHHEMLARSALEARRRARLGL
jgi:ADP-ribose pyrophosphatase YjhB (NUDIX family)